MIALSFSHMHSLKVIHRDFKPDNILVTTIGGQQMFVICDFGAAKRQQVVYLETIKARYTAQYASLEQLEGKEAEPYFDMWALGVLIFRMMVGEEPFPFTS